MSSETSLNQRSSVLVASAAVSVVLGAVLLVFEPIGLNALGYFVGCLVPFTAVAVARRADVRMRGEHGVLAPSWRRGAYVAILVGGFLVAGAHAWDIAWDVARRVQL